MNIADLINEKTISFIDKSDKILVIEELIAKGLLLNKINDIEKFKKAIIERELLMSTGIGVGIAAPHAKIDEQPDFFVITGILKNEVEWDSIDRKPVKLVFLIGGPSNDQHQYLNILSNIFSIVKDSNNLEAILSADNIETIAEIFKK